MSLLNQLFQKYGDLERSQITLQQLEYLRNNLKTVDPSEVYSVATAQQFLKLLRQFRESVAEADKLHGDNYPQLLSSLLSVGEDGLYSNNLRFIFELIQNVDDCDFASTEDHVLNIHFDFNHNKIVLRYNEKGFTPFNVFAITGIAEAAKNVSSGKNEIGEKGIGFKSVFGVTNTVLIRSGWFSFELHKDNFTIPVANYQDKTYCPGTEMTLFVPSGKARIIYNELKAQYCNKDSLFRKNPLLFLNKLTTLKLYYDCFRTMEFHVDRSDCTRSSAFSREDNVRVSVRLHDAENGCEQNIEEEIRCTRYSYSVTFSQAACKARYGEKTQVGSNGGKPMTLHVVFPNPDDVDSVGNGALYSFLPTQLRFNVPLVCHVPFKLDASREFVDPQENKIWFNEACGYFSQLLDYAYQDWSKIVKADIISYLPGMTRSLFADNNGKELCLSRQAAFKGNHFSALPIFYTTNGHFAAIDRIFSFDSAEEVFAPQHAYELLNVTRELFLPPDGKSTQGVGIYTERRIYYRLFDIALKNPAKTEDILSYLSSAGFKPADENIPKESAILNAYQISLLMQCKSFANAFMEHSKVCVNAGKRPTYLIQSPNFVSINAALYGDFKLSEAPKAVEQYLGWCSGNCVLMDINEEQYLPCNNALLLSKKNPLSSFAAFCYAIDSRDTFSIRMKHREISERLNQLSESNEGSADDYLRELRNNRLLGRDAIGKQQYQNYIDLILKSGTNHTRFVQELLQNADDCEYAVDIIPEFSFSQDHDQIVTEYNETGFTRGNIRSITAIGESTKNHLLQQDTQKIGEKGVGFKTIFAVASEVQIHSGDYHFSLKASTPTIPDLLDKNGESVRGTKMQIRLKPGTQLSNYNEREILELCLCLRNLRKIRINNYFVTIEDKGDIRTITINKRLHTFRRFTHPFTIGGDALKERENGLRTINGHQSIVCYIPEKGGAKEYPLYCGLPTKHRINIPLVIDAPFMLTTSREEIETGSRLWNEKIREELYAALLSIMDTLKKTERSSILRFTRFVHRRQGLISVYTNDISNCDFLNKYDFLPAVKMAKILPTFDNNVFVSAASHTAYHYPDAVNFLFSAKCFGEVLPQAALDIVQDDTFIATLNAISCPEVSFAKAFSVIQQYAGRFIQNANFREALYMYLQSAPDEYYESIQQMAIIPVYSIAGEQTEFIAWEDDSIFVKKHCVKSEQNYFILNEAFLPKSSCEKIFGVNVNEMNAESERNRYNDGLRAMVRGSDTEDIYQYLLQEFAKGSFYKYQSAELLIGMKEFIPLKNQLGEIVDAELFICNEPIGYFQSQIILSLSVHDECQRLSEFLKCASLSNIHYQDIQYTDNLTGDDIEDFSTDYFTNGEEILRNFYRDGKITDALVSEYGLDYIAMQYSQDDDYLEFPEIPVRNMVKLREHIRKLLQNPVKIVSRKVERTVKKLQDSHGRESGIDEKEIRNQTLQLYTPEGVHGRCFCQLCRKVKPYEFMEVNNIIASPEYFFPQTRVALCLECSKRFEAMRFSNGQKVKSGSDDPFVLSIKKASTANVGCVDVPIGKSENIRFTATHLAEIQEIFRLLPK